MPGATSMRLLELGLVILGAMMIPALLVGVRGFAAARQNGPSIAVLVRRMRAKTAARLTRLEQRLAHWPLSPPRCLCRRLFWVGLSLAVWGLDYFSHPAFQISLLILGPVLLAAWCGDLTWSLGLALVLPWGRLLYKGVGGCDWPFWIEVLNALERTAMVSGAAVLMTALQRHAVRLAVERDPRLAMPHNYGEACGCEQCGGG